MNNIEEIKKEYRMVLDNAFEDKSYLADKPQMLEEDALFEQVLEMTWNFIEQTIAKSNEEAYNNGLKANQMVDWLPSKISRTEYEQRIREEAVRGFMDYYHLTKHQENIEARKTYPATVSPMLDSEIVESYLT